MRNGRPAQRKVGGYVAYVYLLALNYQLDNLFSGLVRQRSEHFPALFYSVPVVLHIVDMIKHIYILLIEGLDVKVFLENVSDRTLPI